MTRRYCDDRFTAEVVEVEYEKDSIFPEGKSLTYPDFTEKQLDCSVSDMCSTIGATIPVEQVLHALAREEHLPYTLETLQAEENVRWLLEKGFLTL